MTAKKNDRKERKCPKCQGEFAFEPGDGDPVTDMLFLNAIKAISGEGRIRWGVEHLYYEICRRKKRQSWWIGLLIALIMSTVALALVSLLNLKVEKFFKTALVVLPSVLLIATIISYLRHWQNVYVSISQEQFNTWWKRWQAVHGTPSTVIQRIDDSEWSEDLESDIGDYSFDRAVICDRARTVDLLIANNFHFENNCAVLSINGYPKKQFALILKMLKKNPKLQVFVVHDATTEGCRLAHRLYTDPDWFGGANLRVIDLGLRPRHAGPLRGLFLPATDSRVMPDEAIPLAEAEWLTRYKLELASIRPENIIKRIFAGFQAHINDTSGGDAGGVTTCGAFESGGYGDGGAADTGGDAFG